MEVTYGTVSRTDTHTPWYKREPCEARLLVVPHLDIIAIWMSIGPLVIHMLWLCSNDVYIYIYTLCKLNIDTKNDGLEDVSPFKHGYFG